MTSAELAGVYPKIMTGGDMDAGDAGVWSCGMAVRLIDDIPSVRELIDRTMAEAERLIRGRPAGLLGGDRTVASGA